MKFEFLILSDAAQVANNKLFLLGGGWSIWRSGNYPVQVQLGIGISILVDWKETGTRYPLTITIADDAGVPIVPEVQGQFEIGKQPDLPKDAIQKVILAFNANIAIPRPGRYVIAATAGTARTQTLFDAIFVGKKVELMPASGEPSDLGRGN